jgi:hypothetical protein
MADFLLGTSYLSVRQADPRDDARSTVVPKQ